MKPLVYWTKKDEGCYADGGFGLAYQRGRLAGLVRGIVVREYRPDLHWLVMSLESDGPCDLEDMFTAVELLQERTSEGMVWEFFSGDLMLWENDDAD